MYTVFRPAFFNDPWTGFYQLGAPFFTQAQFTQFTEIGWRFIDGAAGQNCGVPANCTLTYATLAAPDLSHFSLIAVNTGSVPLSLNLELAGPLTKFHGTPLQIWRSIETEYFARQADVTIAGTSSFALVLEPMYGNYDIFLDRVLSLNSLTCSNGRVVSMLISVGSCNPML